MIMPSAKFKASKEFRRAFRKRSAELNYDRRYMPRQEICNKAYYRNDTSHQIIVTQLRNLNLAGVSLYVKDDVQVDQRLVLKVALDRERGFVAEATVMWRLRDGYTTYVGCVFNHLDQDKRDLILEHTL